MRQFYRTSRANYNSISESVKQRVSLLMNSAS